VKEPREDHDQWENEVRLKSDVKFWTARNNPAFGGFGVPWGPWGFNSGMDVYDVSREEAIAEGVLAEGEFPLPPKVVGFNTNLEVKTEGMDENIALRLNHELARGDEGGG
jgi:hypothetical protein